MAQTTNQIFASIAGRNMRNGELADVKPIYLTAGIPKEYFVLSEGAWDVDNGSPTVTQRARLDAAVYSAALKATMTADDKRRMACVFLAIGRRAVAQDWRLTDGDHVPTQVSAFRGEWDAAAGAAPKVTVRHEVGAVNNALVAEEWNAITEDLFELDIVKKSIRVAVGTPVTQGVVLVRTGVHHFVDDYKSYFRAMVKQSFGESEKPVGVLSAEEYEDIMGHKLSHTIRSEHMIAWARDKKVKDRFRMANFESAVVRVPAQTDAEQTVSAVRQLIAKTKSSMATANVAIGDAEDQIDAIYGALQEAYKDATTPEDRFKKEREALAMLERHHADIAYVYGYYAAMLADAEKREAGESLSRSKFLKRVSIEHFPARDEGSTAYDLGKRHRRTVVKAGKLPGVGLFGARAPADLGNPDDTNSRAGAATAGVAASGTPA